MSFQLILPTGQPHGVSRALPIGAIGAIKDAAKEFEALDVDGSGGLSAEELQQFKQLRAVGTVDV